MHRCILTSALFFIALLIASPSYGAGIEALINPGPLSEAHAETESDCGACHASFDQSAQRKLCLECHEEVADDINSSSGFHGRNAQIDELPCRGCHTEHEGRDEDISGLIEETFDHDLTNFELQGQHALVGCANCHDGTTRKRETPNRCQDCHADDDAHNGGLGEDCASCHNADQWLSVDFDHQEHADFTLDGAHAETNCTSCHIDNAFTDTPHTCIECHQLDDVHQGSRGDDCGSCHTASDWADSNFDHDTISDFPLTGAHDVLSCANCHLSNMQLAEPPQTCIGCHSANDPHQGTRGDACGDCHSTSTWELSFDHATETGFTLSGSHSNLTCTACHTTNLEDPLPTHCAGCHSEDDPHEDTLGACDTCHQDDAWSPAPAFDHEFTRFPLLGLHDLTTCNECHDSLVFNGTDNTCIACHQSEDAHEGVFGKQCEQCHTPGGWDLWEFDHNTQTKFVLSGAHESLICASCHRTGTESAGNLSTTCINCHLQDDTHNGQFGRDCARCHSTNSFKDSVRFR